MANNRPLSLFLRYRESLDLGLFGRSLALHVAQMESMFYNSERTESLFKQYLESKEDYCGIVPCCEAKDVEEISEDRAEDVEEISEDSAESVRSDTENTQSAGTNVRELPAELPPIRKTKRQKLEQSSINSLPLVSPSVHQVPIQNNASPSTLPFSSLFPNILKLAFRKHDGSYIMTNENVLSNGPAAAAIARAIAMRRPDLPQPQQDPLETFHNLCASQLDVSHFYAVN